MNVRSLAIASLTAVLIVFAWHGRAAAAVTCTITPPTYDFGDYDVTGAKVTTTGTISITCSGGGTPTPLVGISAGSSGDENNRTMLCVSGTCLSTFPGDLLSYGLYSNTSHTTVWGAASAISFGVCTNTTCTKIVYGQIPKAAAGGSNDIAVGGYSDTVTITANY